MDTFIVSARKYRPQNFATVVGQEHITTTLKNAINHNQLAHAFLFTGPRGVGKTTCARILAKTINCENRTPEGEACNTCNSCQSFDQGTSMNIHELDAASNNSVDDIRILTEQVRFAPQAGKYKVYIIDEVHMLSSQAFNAFLKTLEEPPPFAIFILATTEKHKILPTILSRCQIFDFKRITLADTVNHLQEICDKEHIEAEKAALHVIAQKSEGCMRDALSILDKIVSFTSGKLNYSQTLEHLNILDEDYYFRLLEQLQQQQLTDALLLFDEILQKGFEADTLLEGLAEFIRNLLVSKDPKAASLLEVAEDFKTKYRTVAAGLHTGWMISALNILNEGIIEFRNARNKKLLVEMILIKLNYLNQALELLPAQGEPIKKKRTDEASALKFRSTSYYPLGNSVNPAPTTAAEKGNTHIPEKPVIQEARLTIETASRATKPAAPAPSVMEKPVVEPMLPKTSSLSKLRQMVMEKEQAFNPIIPLEQGALLKAWDDYLNLLAAKNAPQADINNAQRAKLEVLDEQSLNIIADNSLQLKFIESGKALIIDHMQKTFNNKLLKVNLVLIEAPSGPVEPKEKTLSSRQQYQAMVEKYPLVQELKDRLNLQLDY